MATLRMSAIKGAVEVVRASKMSKANRALVESALLAVLRNSEMIDATVATARLQADEYRNRAIAANNRTLESEKVIDSLKAQLKLLQDIEGSLGRDNDRLRALLATRPQQLKLDEDLRRQAQEHMAGLAKVMGMIA